MNDNQDLRAKIARALGWKAVSYNDYSEVNVFAPWETLPGWARVGVEHDIADYLEEVPDWPNDIAAAYALEGEIPEDERIEYANRLYAIIDNDEHYTYGLRWGLAHATAEQRCLAWIAWHEWKESQR